MRVFRFLKGLFTAIGFIVVVAGVWGLNHIWSATRDFDENAFSLYSEFAGNLLESGDLADAFVWRVEVQPGLSADDVKESMKSLAVSNNFLFVNDSPFYKQAKAVTGKDHRHVSFMQFCDVQVGISMLSYNDAYSAFMPCVISIVEDKQGKIWLFAMNMDFLIHGARELPPALKANALRVRRVMREIMEGAARGEF